MKNLMAIVLFVVGVVSWAQEAEYVGNLKCKMCHNKEENGAQFSKWETTGHARSLEALKSDAALAIAQERGIKVPPSESGECLPCHVTGWGSPSGYQLSVDPADKKAVKLNASLASVGCEMCHGAGSIYKSKKVMEAIYAGTTPGAEVGLIVPNEETCKSCHNSKSPTFKPFDFKERVAKIAHPYPEQ